MMIPRSKILGVSRRVLSLYGFLLALVLLLIFAPGLRAEADYSFEVPNEDVYVVINQDSSITFTYDIEFKNDGGARPIDIVDVGMPTGNYDLAQCSASVDGVPLTDIRTSTVISPAAEVHLGDNAIQPGATGLFEFTGSTAQMVFTDTGHEGYASMEFMNTYWNPQYAHGGTRLRFSIQFPPGVQPNESVYHGDKYTSYSTSGEALVFTWEHTDATPSAGVVHGVSFPAVYVTGVYPQQPLPDYQPVSGTDYSYEGGGDTFNSWSIIFPVIISVVLLVLRSAASVSRVHKEGGKANYITPSVGVEGAGPKRDLCPTEAAVLMNQELDRVAAIVFMELMQKGLVTLKEKKPAVFYRSASVPQGLPPYQYDFLAAVSPGGKLDPVALKKALTTLIKRVEKRVKGFCYEDTVKYYEELAKSSWVDVKMKADHGERLARFNELLPYLLLHSSFKSKVREAFGPGDYIVPLWISSVAGPQVQDAASGPVEGVKIADIVASGFSAVQDTVYPLVEDMEEDIVKEVNPKEYQRVYIMPYRGFRSGYRGGGCACACACAGCACACAGGGR